MRYPDGISSVSLVYLYAIHGVLLVTHTVHVLQDVLMFVPHNRRLRFDWVIPIGGPLSEVHGSG